MSGRMRAEDLRTDTPSPQELVEMVEQLPAVEADQERAVLELLMRSTASSAETSAEWPPLLEEPRRRADSRYADPATSHRPVIGPVLVAAKRSFRLAFQPFINEMLRRQVEFNESILSSLAVLYEQVRVNARTQAVWRREVEARLRELEAKAAQPKPSSRKK